MSSRHPLFAPRCRTLCYVVSMLAAQLASPALAVQYENYSDWYAHSPQLVATPSPAAPDNYPAANGLPLLFAVSPVAPIVAVVLAQGQQQALQIWQPGQAALAPAIPLPAGVEVTSLVWHPEGKALFLGVENAGKFQLLRQDYPFIRWQPRVLAGAPQALRDLVFSTHPFSRDEGKKAWQEYRLYYSGERSPGVYATSTIRESGRSGYMLMAAHPVPPAAGIVSDDGTPATQFVTASARPASFAPSGFKLLWQQQDGCFVTALYGDGNWDEFHHKALPDHLLCGGAAAYLPNGLGVYYWKPERPGLTVYLDADPARITILKDTSFAAAPQLTGDGKAVLGLVNEGGSTSLRYLPVSLPLADVLNAWNFVSNKAELESLKHYEGNLRNTANEQIFNLYDSEQYRSDDLGENKPYLVTTDLGWELYGAAFESLFSISEDNTAIPAFWRLVSAAQQDPKTARLGQTFAVLAALQANDLKNPEVARILAGQPAVSSVTGRQFDFGALKPRGFYTRSPDSERYFRAMRYLTQLDLDPAALAEVGQLPAAAQAAAKEWIASYQPFIAAPRAPLAWPRIPVSVPSYTRHAGPQPTLFPLSWAFDNEVLQRTVLHTDWPATEQVQRLLPSGLDVAAVLGSPLAMQLQAADRQNIPHYDEQLQQLAQYWQQHRDGAEFGNSLYAEWIKALAGQFGPAPAFPGAAVPADLWSAKRLQTGLASWATLRHSTVLVNDQGGAEAGEGGLYFERIQQRPPRGYVEPDPQTFTAITTLFDHSLTVLDQLAANWQGPAADALRQGYRARLAEARLLVQDFAVMALKEQNGEALSDSDYAEIQGVGGAVEHSFLVFKSAQMRPGKATEAYAIANPPPMTKIADVANAPGQHLLVAVGQPLEWRQVVPLLGRRELVKGAVYAYSEFANAGVMSDEEWTQQADKAPVAPWLAPYFVPDAPPPH